MGQGQSQQKPILQDRVPNPEPEDPVEAAKFREEKNRQQAEERARRAAAAEQRLAGQQQKKVTSGQGIGNVGGKKKNESALEQASRENRGWRDADAQAEMRAYN